MWLSESLKVNVASASSRPPGLSPARCFLPPLPFLRFMIQSSKVKQSQAPTGWIQSRVFSREHLRNASADAEKRRVTSLNSSGSFRGSELSGTIPSLHVPPLRLHHVCVSWGHRYDLVSQSISAYVLLMEILFFPPPASSFSSVSPVLNPEGHNLCKFFPSVNPALCLCI